MTIQHLFIVERNFRRLLYGANTAMSLCCTMAQEVALCDSALRQKTVCYVMVDSTLCDGRP